MITCARNTYYRFAGLSTDTKPTRNIDDGSTFWETDTGKTYEYRAEGGGWILNNNKMTVDEDGAIVLYQSGNYLYVCAAPPGTALTAPLWKIKRFDTANLIMTWANGNSKNINKATNLTIVAALSYS